MPGPCPLPPSLADLLPAASHAADNYSIFPLECTQLDQWIGATLRPGNDTPLWNELVKQAQPLLRKRGSKAQLARLLKLPRQRMQDCLKAQSACLDAERTLLLMCWVAARQQGRELVP